MIRARFLPISVALALLLSAAGCGGEGDDGTDPNCDGEQCYASTRFGLEYRPPVPYIIADKEVVEDSRLIMTIVGEPMPGEFKIIVDDRGLGSYDLLYQLEEQENGRLRVVGEAPGNDTSGPWIATGELVGSNGHAYRVRLVLADGSPSFPSLFGELLAGVTLLD